MTALDDIGFERYRPLSRRGRRRRRFSTASGGSAGSCSPFAYNADFRIYLRAETLEELQFSSIFTVVTDGASVLVALLAIAVVHRTTERQGARAEQLRETSPAETEGERGIFPPPDERRRSEGDQVR
jgi:hypothetical protein